MEKEYVFAHLHAVTLLVERKQRKSTICLKRDIQASAKGIAGSMHASLPPFTHIE